MNVMILGDKGQLGWALTRRLARTARVTGLDREEIDIGDLAALEAAIDAIRPQVIYNAAAYTAVDRAETERDAAYAVNARAPGVLARACARHGALLVHYSTDYVYDGRKAGRYLETDPTGPLNVYGASKLEGDLAVLEADGAAVVLRTTWVYGDHGGNFAKTMLRLAGERDALRVVADQRGTPTWAGRLAELSERIVQQAVLSGDPAGWLAERRGVYHASAAGETDWADYARCVIGTAASLPALARSLRMGPDAVESISSADYPTPAARPANSLLDGSKLERTFGYALPDWQVDVVDFVARLAQAARAG